MKLTKKDYNDIWDFAVKYDIPYKKLISQVGSLTKELKKAVKKTLEMGEIRK